MAPLQGIGITGSDSMHVIIQLNMLLNHLCTLPRLCYLIMEAFFKK